MSGTESLREARDVEHARIDAEEAMRRYALALWYWNAPDKVHTRHQARALTEQMLDEMFEEVERG